MIPASQKNVQKMSLKNRGQKYCPVSRRAAIGVSPLGCTRGSFSGHFLHILLGSYSKKHFPVSRKVFFVNTISLEQLQGFPVV